MKIDDVAHKIKNIFLNLKSQLGIISVKCKNLVETNYELGVFHFQKGNLVDAELRFNIVKKFRPNHFGAFYHLARIYLIKGKTSKAIDFFNKASALEPNSEEVKYFISKIKNTKPYTIPENLIKEYFNQVSNDYQEEYVKNLGYEANILLDRILNELNIEPPSTILDLGCGTGESAKVLKQHYPEAVIDGVDFAVLMIEKARQAQFNDHALYNKVYYQNIAFLTLPRYDLVAAINVLDYQKDQLATLEKIKNRLNDNGTLIATFALGKNKISDNLQHYLLPEELLYQHIKQNKWNIISKIESSIYNNQKGIILALQKDK